MCGEQGFKAVHKTVHLVKCIGKGCLIFFFRVLMLRYLIFTECKVLGFLLIYLAAQQQNKLTQFPVCANVDVLFSLEILPQACLKHIQTRFSL